MKILPLVLDANLPPDSVTCIAPTSGQLCNEWDIIQVMESISGSVVPLAMFSLTGEDNTILTEDPDLGPDVHKERREFPRIHKSFAQFNSKHCINVKKKMYTTICTY